MIKKIKYYYFILKNYFKILLDFKNLNKYIYLSSIFLNRVEQLLNSNLDQDTILKNIEISFSAYKIDYDDEDFNIGTNVDNKFER